MSDITTITGESINSNYLHKYFKCLVNQFFKVLPMRENEEASAGVYLESLRNELIGFGNLIPIIHQDALFVTLLSTLQFFIDYPECPIPTVKRGVFKAISICNKLAEMYENTEEV